MTWCGVVWRSCVLGSLCLRNILEEAKKLERGFVSEIEEEQKK